MNDPKLKPAMARLLPEKIAILERNDGSCVFAWKLTTGGIEHKNILETEWLYVMHLVEKSLTAIEWLKYMKQLANVVWGSPITMESTTRLLWESSFNQRATAMCQVKGITP